MLRRMQKKHKQFRERAKAQLEGAPSGRPDPLGTVEAHEAAVAAQPNSGKAWASYMSFLAGLGEVDGARSLAERALKSIAIPCAPPPSTHGKGS